MSEQPQTLPEAPAKLLDRSDARVKHAEGLGGAVSAFVERVRSGDLGSLPVIVGLVIIWTVFTSLNPVFLSADNLGNLLFDCSTTGVIALGIVCVLMVGQIDLSVGSISGFASALVGVLWVNQGWPVLLAIVAALVVGGLMGAVYALLFNRLGMPSFVATLAGLLAILGLQLYLLGSSGSINLPYGSTMVNFGQLMVIPAIVSHLVALVPGAVILLAGFRTRARRQAVNLSAPSVASLMVRALAITVLLQIVVLYLDRGRGVPLMFGLFLALAVAMDYALRRTRWGRSMNAVGGNREAARRAGINVNMIFTSAFVLCASLASLGGVLSAARLASASQQAGTGDVNLNA
ncbi:MAG TPA: sugar ABC transporter permease, partial [Dermatophilaceae bacterium]|nr:sugar ABC transporter permease [Dermatophilaceae bacterium]